MGPKYRAKMTRGSKWPLCVSVNRDTASARHSQTSTASKIRCELTCYSTGINSLVQMSNPSEVQCIVPRLMMSLDFLITYLLCRFINRSQLIVRRNYPNAPESESELFAGDARQNDNHSLGP